LRTRVPGQTPRVHWSLIVERLPSLQRVPSAREIVTQPPLAGSQLGTAHWERAPHAMGVPLEHAPLAPQLSTPLQALRSSQWEASVHCAG
jgi:hypothetical protein